jgi:hypothetical protein
MWVLNLRKRQALAAAKAAKGSGKATPAAPKDAFGFQSCSGRGAKGLADCTEKLREQTRVSAPAGAAALAKTALVRPTGTGVAMRGKFRGAVAAAVDSRPGAVAKRNAAARRAEKHQ